MTKDVSNSDISSHVSKAPEQLFLDVLFACIGDGAIATDEFSRVVRINSAALGILGFTESEIIGKWFPRVIVSVKEDGSIVNAIDRPITKAFISGHTITEKTYYRHKKGKQIPVSITVSPIVHKGRPIGAINLFRDITQEYEIDRMKSEFISLASHQLRTPLSSIKAYSHMLSDGYMGKLQPEQEFAVNSIIDASSRMNQLTDTLLNIARIESGFMTIAKRDVNLVNLTKKIIEEHNFAAKEKNITLSLQSNDQVLSVETDVFITTEILSNLLSNAIKYTPAGGKVSIALNKHNSEVTCSISDSGIGIPKESHPQIFNKFYRAPNVLTRDTTGTGLGLYLIKSLADKAGIPLWFESEVGKGSTFYFSVTVSKTKKSKTTKEQKKLLKESKGKI
jgi:PAS domain S-box-containing protein